MIFLQAAIGLGLIVVGLFWFMVLIVLPILTMFIYEKLKKKENVGNKEKRYLSDNLSTGLVALLFAVFIVIIIGAAMLFVLASVFTGPFD